LPLITSISSRLLYLVGIVELKEATLPLLESFN